MADCVDRLEVLVRRVDVHVIEVDDATLNFCLPVILLIVSPHRREYLQQVGMALLTQEPLKVAVKRLVEPVRALILRDAHLLVDRVEFGPVKQHVRGPNDQGHSVDVDKAPVNAVRYLFLNAHGI